MADMAHMGTSLSSNELKLLDFPLESSSVLYFKGILNNKTANTRDLEEWTPLHHLAVCHFNLNERACADSGTIELMRYLVCKCDADINAKTWVGNTPLHLTLHNMNRGRGSYGIMKTLLELKASVDIEYVPLVRYLLDYGSNIDERGSNINKSEFSSKIVWLLLEYGAKLPENMEQKFGWVADMISARKAARRATVIFIGIRRASVILNTNNKDIIRFIGQMIWKSRKEYREWT